MKCGYVALLGLSNAGKSSLMNYFVGEEVAVVSHRKQTTRNSILGICNKEGCQIIFVDTPGIHHSKNNLDKFMNKTVRSATAGADVVVYLFDGSVEMTDEERENIENLQKKYDNFILVCTKADKKQIENHFPNAIRVSIANGEGTKLLLEKIVELLPNQEAIFDQEQYTDKSVSFLICEKIRGILLENLDKEIPHGVAVEIEKFEETEDCAKIVAIIICEREQHKGIIIGKNGANLKILGQKTRIYAENLLDKKCVLKLFVKADENWRDKNVGIYGYK